MASRNPASGKPSHTTAQKKRSGPASTRARASEEPAGRSTSTGGRADRASVRSDQNSRSSNAGRQGPQRRERKS